ARTARTARTALTALTARALEVFDRARDVPAERRAAWLSAACGDDATLRRQVERLLDASRRSGGILDRPLHVQALQILSGGIYGDIHGDIFGGTPGDASRDIADDTGSSAGPSDAPSVPARPPSRTDPIRIDRYRILERLGGGGMGTVYRALDERLQRLVALKVLSGFESTSPGSRERSLSEARAAASLDHPNLCPVYDAGEADGYLYIAMGYCAGETLEARLENGPLPIAEALAVATAVADGLASAHAAGIVHRDIKPSNVMLEPSGGVKIVDFGIAKRSSVPSNLSLAGARFGTPAYMSPEQARGEEVDGRTDLWSLGCILYEMLTGKRAFPQKGELAVLRAILEDDPLPASTLRPGVPSAVDAILRRALAKDRDRRWATAAEMRDALERAAPGWLRSGGEPAPRPTIRPDRLPLPPTRLIGRDDDVEQVFALLASSRLVTLTGPAGTGKTRLSLEVARRASASFEDGTCFVPLAGVEDPSLLPSMIARNLGLLDAPAHETAEGLASAIEDRSLLLVLDDFERIVSGAAAVVSLLERCPAIKILVTSRVVLRVSGEQAFPVPPLALSAQPGDSQAALPRPERAASSPAVELFLERARAVRPGLALDGEELAAVLEILSLIHISEPTRQR
ncbi:MAG: protein kinase, partial [Candidatus Eisenbacteria bacterium]|nr:protein kinase [Candidatus Eisenbacteria bacterium]